MEDNLATACQQVFKTRAGQNLLSLIEELYGHRRSFSKDDPYETAFKEGQRDTALYLIQLGRKK